jgi:EAL domain-containing protein (putative c-di-GMP-specific phosphodiesterase class I)
MDMEFGKNMLNDSKSLKLVTLVMDIAKFLNVPVVAEGVESKEQLDTLHEMGCEIIQGFYFSRPVPAEEFEAFIQKEVELRKEEA